MTTTQQSIEELKQINVRLSRSLHDRLTLEAARRTVAEGKEVTRQDLILEALEGKQEAPKRLIAWIDGKRFFVRWDEMAEGYIGHQFIQDLPVSNLPGASNG